MGRRPDGLELKVQASMPESLHPNFAAWQISANNLSVKQSSTQICYKSHSGCSCLTLCLKPASSILAWISFFEHLLILIWLSLSALSLVPDLIFSSLWLHFYLHICCYEKDKLMVPALQQGLWGTFLSFWLIPFVALGKSLILSFSVFPCEKRRYQCTLTSKRSCLCCTKSVISKYRFTLCEYVS